MAHGCAGPMREPLEQLKSALRRDNMVLNDGKQQVLGRTKKARIACEPYGTSTRVDKVLGVCHYGYNDKHQDMEATLAADVASHQHEDQSLGGQKLRGSMMASVLYGQCLYGAECHYIIKRQTQRMRRIMCTAMGDAQGRRPDSVRLLVESGGK